MKKYLLGLLVLTVVAFAIALFIVSNSKVKNSYQPLWDLRSIDTVKYSRDIAGQMLVNTDYDSEIDRQVSDIADTGASYIAIATPYDEKFVPFLKRWVISARKHKLKVWFRGNFSGWEGWFDYSKIGRDEHKKLLDEFIVKNPDLFEDGDIFTPCPECENGGPGDPRTTGDIDGFKNFLIEEYNISNRDFGKINKKIFSGYYSMNYDVASLVMDKQTTKNLGGIVVIDHYVSTPEKLVSDVKALALKSGGKVILGEFGVPIPDINGDMNEDQQAVWIESALSQLSGIKELGGVNYWVSRGGSTQLWDEKGVPRKAVAVIEKYYKTEKLITPR